MLCNTCKENLDETKFYYRNDTKKYMNICKKCYNKSTWKRIKNNEVNHHKVFDYICKSCNIQKTSDDFYMKDTNTNRYDTTCKSCRKKGAKQWHSDNIEASKQNKKIWHSNNREANLEKFKENHQRRMETNPEHEYNIRKTWRINNTEKINKMRRNRCNSDINFKIGCNLRSNCYRMLKLGGKKQCKTLELLNCSIEFLKKWLESQFYANMSWENMGSYWHIDHFIPVSNFDLTDFEMQKQCFRWINLQPLTKTDNLRKNNKIPSEEEQVLHANKVKTFCMQMDVKSNLPSIKGNVDGKQLDTLLESVASDYI